MQNWKNIWEKKELKKGDESVLSKLIAVDGFDTGFGTISEDDWTNYVAYISKKLNLNSNNSIFEVGCGSGAFLYNFYKEGYKVSGIDYSKNLVNIANTYLESGTFFCMEAINIDQSKKYDIVLSNSVFFYFPSLDYAGKVLIKMIEKSNDVIAVLEVNDYAYKEESLKIRKSGMDSKTFNERYQGLDHIYYKKEWFEDIAKKHNLRIEIEQQNIRNYQNNSYRFNVFLYKD